MERKPPRYSPAALVLASRGITQAEIARGIGRTVQAVSMQLAGHRRPDPALLPVIRALSDQDVARRVEELLGAAR